MCTGIQACSDYMPKQAQCKFILPQATEPDIINEYINEDQREKMYGSTCSGQESMKLVGVRKEEDQEGSSRNQMSHSGHPGNIKRNRYKELTEKELKTLYFIAQPIGVNTALNTTGTSNWYS